MQAVGLVSVSISNTGSIPNIKMYAFFFDNQECNNYIVTLKKKLANVWIQENNVWIQENIGYIIFSHNFFPILVSDF